MRHGLLEAIMAVLAAGCSQDGPSDANANAASPVAERNDFSHNFVSVVLPPKVDLDFSFVLVGDRLYTRENGGETRRGLMLEFTEGTPESVSSAVIAGFRKGGYAAKKPPATKPGGQVSYVLSKNGAANIYVDIRPVGNRKLETQRAAGTVWLSWQVRSADASAAE